MASPSTAPFEDVRLYLCTSGRRNHGDFAEFVDAAYSGGVDVVQLREKGLEAREELALLEVLAEVAARHRRLWAVNDRADIAAVSGAPVLHLGQGDLAPADARRLVGRDVVIGTSTHTPTQLAAAAADPDVDYLCVGPVWATPTKPGRPAAGLELVRAAASRDVGKPWFAIGGIDLSRLDEVLGAGAARIVVVRAVTDADAPRLSASALASRLRAVG